MRLDSEFNISLGALVGVMSDDFLVRGRDCGKASLTVAALVGSLIVAADITAAVKLSILVLKVISSRRVMYLRLMVSVSIEIVIEATHPVWNLVRMWLHIVNLCPFQQGSL